MPPRKVPLYVPSRRAGASAPAPAVASAQAGPAADASNVKPPTATGMTRRWQRLRTLGWAGMGALLALAIALALTHLQPHQRIITQAQIDAAVRHSLEKEPLPSRATKAYEGVARSVVRVIGLMDDRDDSDERPDKLAMERSLGTGVVIKDDGTILTNLHVVWGAKRVRVTFANGHESDARMVGAQPENDLAVLKANSVPDDLEPATMRSTGDLSPGDEVIAVGHPFGIGPSVSAGVVSGLGREFRSPEGQNALTNLIQFDAAANPGNSGGPLVTMDGFVVGIVTAILNPNEQRTFVGIGFAVPIENAAGAAGMAPF
jgi:S1-C subfamily serine protease